MSLTVPFSIALANQARTFSSSKSLRIFHPLRRGTKIPSAPASSPYTIHSHAALLSIEPSTLPTYTLLSHTILTLFPLRSYSRSSPILTTPYRRAISTASTLSPSPSPAPTTLSNAPNGSSLTCLAYLDLSKLANHISKCLACSDDETVLNLAWRLEVLMPDNQHEAYVSAHDPSKSSLSSIGSRTLLPQARVDSSVHLSVRYSERLS